MTGRPDMARISDPMQIQHPVLRDMAIQAAFFAKLAESIGELECLCNDLPAEERAEPMPREGPHENADPADVARHSQISAYQETLLAFEEHIAI